MADTESTGAVVDDLGAESDTASEVESVPGMEYTSADILSCSYDIATGGVVIKGFVSGYDSSEMTEFIVPETINGMLFVGKVLYKYFGK